ncbi:MAG: hypothetical protein P4L85_00930 [Paludisphaera borealis]|uniref:hypothetical protein n=1 Tax=Paludisphaera borealis TaxID=1387353 RepID=UPI002849014B|nr:hypothetical protein [Paludisphaera borealis]MDR3617884.1 hypothetical protein [Paludisphaera borealis]
MNDRTEALDKLLNDLEPTDPALQARYRSILDAGLADLKPGGGKARYIAIGLAGLIGCVVCGSLGLTEPESTPRAVRWLLILFAFFGLGWTLLAGWMLARGRGNFAAERLIAARMAFGFTLVAVTALSLTSSLLGKESASMPLVATGLALLILGAVLLIGARIEQAEQTIREQILRLECRIAGFAEAVSRAREARSGQIE